MPQESITEEQALVLQTINDSGEADFAGISRNLRMSRAHLAMALSALKQRGLIIFAHAGNFSDTDVWIRLSGRGRGLMYSIWPESARAV